MYKRIYSPKVGTTNWTPYLYSQSLEHGYQHYHFRCPYFSLYQSCQLFTIFCHNT